MSTIRKTGLLVCLLLTFAAVSCGNTPAPAAAMDTGTPAPAETSLPTASPEAATLPTPTPAPTPTPTPTPCPHPAFEAGRCTLCGDWCPHPAHDPATLVCRQCGLTVPHNFLGSRCDMCGTEPEFITGLAPRGLFNPIDHRGTVETLSYDTQNYADQRWGEAPVEIHKKMQVYLPYGYDPAEKYDVLILLHGMGGGENYWLSQLQQYSIHDPEDLVYTSRMLDQLMDSGYCRKMIIAAPTFYRNSADQWDYYLPSDEIQFVRELRQDILPLLVEEYSTYAESGDIKDISAARKHFAYAGLSMGSIYAYTSMMPQCLDIFGWFGCFSGSDGDMVEVAMAVNVGIKASYPIYYFYNSIGTQDSMYDMHKAQYKELTNMVDGLTDGENAAFTTLENSGHIYQAWCSGLYNFLRVVFAQPQEH